MQSGPSYLRNRVRLVLAAAALGALVTLCGTKAAGPGVPGLLDALGGASTAVVSEFAWEPSSGSIADLLFGRGVLFVGQRAGEKYSELYRAFVRLSPEGRVLGVLRLRNLSQTDLASESGLRAHARHALFVSESETGEAILTVLDVDGERGRSGNFVDRIELGLTRYLEKGTASGLGECDVVLPEKLSELHVAQQDKTLRLRLDGRAVELDLAGLFDPNSQETHGLTILRRSSQAPPLGHWAADVGRALLGPAAVASMEELALSVSDRFARAGYRLTHRDPGPAKTTLERPPAVDEATTTIHFPPAALPSPWPKPEAGEGHWVPFATDLMPAALSGGSAPLMRTFVRPDPERPYVRAELVAIDTTRLDLGLRAGYEDPRPRTGPPGSGHVPDDPRVYSRIVATFNGAFKTTHGAYGMKAEDRVLVPPVAGAATLRIDSSGAVGLGTYRPEQGPTVAAQRLDEAPAYRQNLDLLLQGDQLLPTGRVDWGDHLVGSTVVAERSGLCVRTDGHLVYVWSQETTARTLARAMHMAGCVRGMHLDMNPGHSTFAAHRIESFQPLRTTGRLLSPAMHAKATRYVRWSPKDFFYLAHRDPYPRSDAAALLSFAPSPGHQPAPPELPALILGQRTVAGIELEIERVDQGRLTLSLAVGTDEVGVPKPESAPSPSSTALVAWGIGHATLGSRPGLSQADRPLLAHDRRFATLVLPKTGGAYVKLPGDPIEPATHHDLVQLDLVARDGVLLDAGRRITTRREHSALCIDDAGYLWFGRMQHDTPAPLIQALVDLGCRHVLEADRGSQSPASVERAGVEPGLAVQRPWSALVGTARPMRGRAYAF